MTSSEDIPKMTLWYYPGIFRPVRCAWLIKELELPDVQYKFVDILSDPPSPEREQFRQKVHLHSTVPALEIEGGPTLLESSSICLYLAELGGDKFAPELSKRAEYYDWILYTVCRLDESLDVLGQQWWYGPKDKTEKTLTKAKGVVNLCLDRVESTLKEGGRFILGKELTAADCVLGFSLHWADHKEMDGGIMVRDRPIIQAYLQRIRARPALQFALNLPYPKK